MSGSNRKFISKVQQVERELAGVQDKNDFLQTHQLLMEYKIDSLIEVLSRNVLWSLWFLVAPKSLKQKILNGMGNDLMKADELEMAKYKQEKDVESVVNERVRAKNNMSKNMKTHKGGKNVIDQAVKDSKEIRKKAKEEGREVKDDELPTLLFDKGNNPIIEEGEENAKGKIDSGAVSRS